MNELEIFHYLQSQTETPTLEEVIELLDFTQSYPNLPQRCVNMGIVKSLAGFKKVFATAAKRHETREAIRAEIGCVPTTTREFIDALLQVRSFTLDVRDHAAPLSWECPDEERRRPFSSEPLLRFARDLNRNLLRNQFKDSDLTAEVEQQIVRMNIALRKQIFRYLTAPGAFDWHELVTGLFDCSGIKWEIQAAALQKVIWMTKRRMDDMPITNHLMPVIFGKQGSGKTEFIIRMFSVLGPLWGKGNFQRLDDPREAAIFRKFVVFLDEMQKASLAEMGTIKDVITRTHVSYRPMGTNGDVTIEQRSAFIGATNKMLGQVITDTTGNRRFFQLYFKVTAGRSEWDYINGLDFAAMWQSVDHRAADPCLPYMKEMESIREENAVGSTVDQFVEHLIENEGRYLAGRDRDQYEIGAAPLTKDQVYLAYRDYCKALEIGKPYEQNSFLAELRRLYSMDPDYAFQPKKTNKFNGWEFTASRPHAVVLTPFRGRS